MNYTDQLLIRFDDVCANKHNFNEQSVEANKKVNKEIDRQRIINFLTSNGNGYSKQIARYMNKELHKISGRLSELKLDGVIADTGLRQEGCAIYKLNNNQ